MSIDQSRRFAKFCLGCVAMCLVPTHSWAATISLGTLSFDTFIPGSPNSPGVNAFNVSNLTGSFGLPPDFPVIDNLTFQGASLTLNPIGGAQRLFRLGDLGPGFLFDSRGNPIVQVPSNEFFASAEFTATFSAAVFRLAGGTSFTAGSTAFDVLLLPSRGQSLTTDIDQTTISASTAPTTGVPEPGTWQVTVVVLAWLVSRLRRSK